MLSQRTTSLSYLLCTLCICIQFIHAADIQFYSSLSYNSPGFESRARDLAEGTKLAFTSYNNKIMRSGVLINRNLTLNVLADDYTQSQVENNINTILNIPEDQVLGIVHAGGPTPAEIIRQTIAGTNIPWISPTTGSKYLRSWNNGNTTTASFLRNIINVRVSYRDEIATMVEWISNVKRLPKISIYYSSHPVALEGFEALQAALQTFGVGIASNASYTNENDWEPALRIIAEGKPSAVLLWAGSSAIKLFLDGARELELLPPSTIFIISYDGNYPIPSLDNATWDYYPNIYTSFMFPGIQNTNNKLVTQFLHDKNLYNPNSTYLSSPFSIEGYYAGIWIGFVLERMDATNANNLTRSNFLDAIYTQSQMFNVFGKTSGPIGDNCDLPGVFGCCNQVVHSLELGVVRPWGIEKENNTEYIWQTCDSLQTILTSINFGLVYDENDPLANSLISGIEMGFLKFNTDSNRAGLRPLRLIRYVISNNTDVTVFEATRDLVEKDQVVALVGFSEEFALDERVIDYIRYETDEDRTNLTNPNSAVPLIGMVGPRSYRESQIRSPFRPYYINLQSGIKDQIATALDFLREQELGRDQIVNLGLYTADAESEREPLAFLQLGISSFAAFGWPNGTVFNTAIVRVYTTDTNAEIQQKLVGTAVNYWIFASDADAFFLVTEVLRIEKLTPLTQKRNVNEEEEKQVQNGTKNKRQTRPPPFSVVVLNNVDSFVVQSNVIRQNSTVPVYGVSTFAFDGDAGDFWGSKFTLLTDFTTDSIAEGGSFDASSLTGYFTAFFIGAVVRSINDIVDRKTFLKSIYNTQNFEVKGVLAGAYTNVNGNETESCNQGSHVNFVSIYNPDDPFAPVQRVHRFNWTSCGAEFEFPVESGGSDSNTIAIIIPTVVGGALLCAICFLILLMIYIIFTRSRSSANKRKKLKEPRYEEYAYKPIFVDKPSIDALYIAASTHAPNDVKEKDLLNKVETFILNTDRAYAVIQALAKAGIAREDIAACIVYIYQANSSTTHLLKKGIQKEIGQAESEATLFREDSPLAAVYMNYSKLIGLQYLWYMLAETLIDVEEVAEGRQTGNSILLHPSSYEVDPVRLEAKDDHLVNMLHLKLAAQTTFNKIKISEFPFEMSNVLQQIRKKMVKTFPELTLAVIANFVFLRFICLAITSPSKYGLSKKPPVGKNLRFLVLMSKVMQNLGFGVEFEKERYMTDLNDFIVNNKAPMNSWLEDVSGGGDEMKSKQYVTVEVTEVIRSNSLKWLYSAMHQHRQVLRRELAKKLDDNAWEECLSQLEEMGVFGKGGSSDSWTTSGTEAEVSKKATTDASGTGGGGSHDEDDEDEDDSENSTDTDGHIVI